MARSSRNNATEKNAELLLQSEKLFIDALINSLPGILYLYNEQRQFLRWNKSFETVSGYSAEEIGLIHPLDFFRDEEKPLITQKMTEAFEKGSASVEAVPGAAPLERVSGRLMESSRAGQAPRRA